MKKLVFILLSVVLLGSTGCNLKKEPKTEKKDAGIAKVDETITKSVSDVDLDETEKKADTVKEDTETMAEESDENQDVIEEQTSQAEDKTAKIQESDVKKESDRKNPKEPAKDAKNETASKPQSKPVEELNQKPKEECNPVQKEENNLEIKEEKNPAPKEEPVPQAVAYSPERVVSLVISKCQAGGMVTTEQNLQNHLNSGKITQEEYEEYYPLDGLENSYYSVFVNVDLNKAATISGKALDSEEAIAQYIADMFLLETETVFNIRYTGTTQTSGETFYEFRCYR